jgi:hypothetical protein
MVKSLIDLMELEIVSLVAPQGPGDDPQAKAIRKKAPFDDFAAFAL